MPSRQTVDELYEEWSGQLRVSERTLDHYTRDYRLHLKRRLGRRKAQDVTVDDVARLIGELEREGLAGWTIRGVLTALSAMYSWAVRRGRLAVNPVRGLERGERPAAEGRASATSPATRSAGSSRRHRRRIGRSSRPVF